MSDSNSSNLEDLRRRYRRLQIALSFQLAKSVPDEALCQRIDDLMVVIRERIAALEPANDNPSAPEPYPQPFQPRRGTSWVLKRAAPGLLMMLAALLLARPGQEARETVRRSTAIQGQACRDTADFLDTGNYPGASRPHSWNQDCSATMVGNKTWRVTAHIALPTAETLPVAAELYGPLDDNRLHVCRLDIAGVEVFASAPEGGCELLAPNPGEGPVSPGAIETPQGS